VPVRCCCAVALAQSVTIMTDRANNITSFVKFDVEIFDREFFDMEILL
jgi:hypothetical protein